MSKYQPIQIAHSRPFLGAEERQAVLDVLDSGWIAQGPRVAALEDQWRQRTRSAGAVAVASGLAALRLALASLGVGPGDEVVMPAYSCVALMNAALALGAKPVLADVLLDSWTISPVSVRSLLTQRSKAIIAVHLFGMPADIEALEGCGVPVIEDCAHGIGGSTPKGPYGGCGTLSIASFYATKMIAVGEGGIVSGSAAGLMAWIRNARDYGDQEPNGLYLNDKMTDIEAALALAQVARLPFMLASRKERANRYFQLLDGLAQKGLLVLPSDSPGRIWYRFVVRLARHSSAAISSAMAEFGIRGEQPVWDLRQTSVWRDDLVNVAIGFERNLSLPLYPGLTDREQDLICDILVRCLEHG